MEDMKGLIIKCWRCFDMIVIWCKWRLQGEASASKTEPI